MVDEDDTDVDVLGGRVREERCDEGVEAGEEGLEGLVIWGQVGPCYCDGEDSW